MSSAKYFSAGSSGDVAVDNVSLTDGNSVNLGKEDSKGEGDLKLVRKNTSVKLSKQRGPFFLVLLHSRLTYLRLFMCAGEGWGRKTVLVVSTDAIFTSLMSQALLLMYMLFSIFHTSFAPIIHNPYCSLVGVSRVT